MTDLRHAVTRLSAAVDRLEAMAGRRRPTPAEPTEDATADRLLLDELSLRLDRVIATMRTALGAEP